MFSRKYIPEEQARHSIGDMVNAYGIPDQTIQEIFEEGGDLSRSMEGYSFRSAQHQAAQMAARAFKLRKQAVIEAGTGTGKSVAFAVPAILNAMEEKKPVVLSTSNNLLIGQYANKDLKQLLVALDARCRKRFGRPFRFAVAKGRSNYLCRLALKSILINGRFDKYQDALELIEKFESVTKTGDLAEFRQFDLKNHPLGKHLVGTREECPGPTKCSLGEVCFYYNQRDEWAQVDLIVTNHALLAISLVMPDKILPDFGTIIVDEAHQLERCCTDWLTTNVTPERWWKLLGKAEEWLANKSGLSTFEVCNHFDEWFATCRPNRRPRLPESLLAQTALILGEISGNELTSGLVESINEQCLAIRSVCEPDEHRDRAAWILEKDGETTVKSAPVNVGSFLKARLWTRPGVVTSATICTSKGGEESFEYIKRQLGLETRLTLQVPSPFDWDRNLLYLFSNPAVLREADVTRKNSETHEEFAVRWAGKISPAIAQMIKLTQGRAFIICTTTAVYKAVYANLVQMGCPFPIKQQSDLSKPDMLNWFRSTPNPVLVCTVSYREGVDIADDQLSFVCLDRLEFPNQNEPLEAAKMKALGDTSFQTYQIPYCIANMRQTVGRLLRRMSNVGVFCCLDPRIHTKKYGRQILAALPGQAERALDRRGPVDITGFLARRVDAWGQPRTDVPSPVAQDLDAMWAEIEGDKGAAEPTPDRPASDRFKNFLDKSGLKTSTRLKPSSEFAHYLNTRKGNDDVA